MKLKPCPFCGGEAEYVRPNENECFLFIRCKRCKTRTKPIGVDFYTQKYSYERLAEHWNKRVTSCEECPIAQNTNLEDDDSICRDCGAGE